MLTASQISWAMQHDWFRSVSPNGKLCVVDLYVDSNGVVHEDLLLWDKSFEALLAWAGY